MSENENNQYRLLSPWAYVGYGHIAPSIPKAWDGFEIEKDFRGCHLHIVVKNPDHVERGCKSLLVNGQAVEGDYIPKELLSEQTEIELTM